MEGALTYINASSRLGTFSCLFHLLNPSPFFLLIHKIMNQQSPEEIAGFVVSALEKYGQDDYIGESISQLEHCLQAAHQAYKASMFCFFF